MANFNVTPNMNLPNPVPGVDPGPDYAENIQSCINITDQHNHSAGQGVLIQPNGLNISSDLPFNGNNATSLRSVRFDSQLTPIPNVAPDIGILYVAGNELWYNDYNGGNQVQITTNGLINATSSGISSGTATATFSAGVLVVKSSSTSFANIDVQSVVLANAGNLVNQLTLLAPTISSSYDLTLPSLPSATAFMTLDNAGTMSGSIPTANGITRNNLAAVGQQISSSSGSGTISAGSQIPNASVTITTTGRPVMIMMNSTPGNRGFLTTLNSGNSYVEFFRDGVSLSGNSFGDQNVGGGMSVSPSSLQYLDTPAAGTYNYRAYVGSVSGPINISEVRLIAYEL